MPDETKPYGSGQPLGAPVRVDMDRAQTEMASPALAPTVAAIPTERALDATVAASPVRFPQPVALELAAGTSVGEYRVQHKLGEGGMGAVYAGEQPTIGKRVAIKVLAPHCASEPELVRRFVEEARAANRIHHPHIIDIFSFGQLPDGRHYFVMEFLDGESMAEAIDKGSLRPAELCRLLCQICGALEASHQVGIVHRDLKPENIWIARPPHGESYVKLLDFGIAKLLDPTRTNLTQTGAVMGTPLFMAPEQCMGRQVDARTDIYALGVILYRIFAGQFPFQGTVITELVFKHVTEAAAPPSCHRDMPPDVERIILDCLAKDPAARPQSAQVLGERLATALGAWPGIGVVAAARTSAQMTGTVPAVAVAPGAVPEPTRPIGRTRTLRRPALLLGAGLIAAALLTGATLLRRTKGGSPREIHLAPPSQPVAVARPVAAGRLSVSIQNGPDNRVLLDGKEIARGQTNVEAANLAPGTSHRLVVEAPGRRPFQKDFFVTASSAVDMPISLESEKPRPIATRGFGKTRAPSTAKTTRETKTPMANNAAEPRPAPPPSAPPPSEPAEAKTTRKTVPDENIPPVARPSRAQERGLLDVNPLRR
ncbi:MAG TPA: serine/threonine-protein kinase [Polyangia bacterium]|jgi:Serine/threonine protein kinase|nr:serine/threonine-protein kinase [Polyangia bacterium]